MSDTLREALEELAERTRPESLGESVPRSQPDRTARVIASRLRAILDAYPDDTTEEWGLESFDGNGVMLTRSKESACELLMSDEYLVSRRVTPWQRAK